VSASGNITGGNLLAPTGQISAAGNITSLNVNTGIVSATGNITGANLRTGGSVDATGNITGGNLVTLGTANVGNITTANISAGNIISAIISATGNISGPNIVATILQVAAILSVTGNTQSGNVLTTGLISATGNITGNYFLGDGSQLTNITVAKIANGTTQVNIPVSSGNANITVGGTSNVAVFSTAGEYVTGLISASGNVTGGNLIGQNLTAGRVAIVGSGKEVSDDADFTYNSSTNVLSVAGNVNANYFNGNVIATGNLSTTGNVIGNYFIGNGSQLTGVLTTITPNALSSTVHVAAVTTGNTANIISDATTANTANTLVLRDANGAINVSGWTVGARLTAVNYTATNSDYWIGTTTKNKTITLPNAANGASNGRQYQIADSVHAGNPGTTIAAQSPATVVGNQPSQQGQLIIATYVSGVWYCN
jgi:hypothetical protein